MTPLPLPQGSPLPDKPLWVNGRIVRGDEAALSLFDRGARDGQGLFETLRLYRGQPWMWERHLERFILSAAILGFPVPPAPSRLREGIDQLASLLSLTDGVARFTVTRGIPGGRPTRTGAWIEVEPLGARLWPGTRSGGASLMVSVNAFEPGPLGRHKTTSRLAYLLALEEARAVRADEALLVAADGEVLEGAVSNVFAVRDGQVCTPPLARGILPGTVRATVLALCAERGIAAREGRLTLEDLESADELFLTNSVQEVVPVATFAGRTLPSRETALLLANAYREMIERALD